MGKVRIYQNRRNRIKEEDIIEGGLPGLFRYRGHATGITEAPTIIVQCPDCLTWYGRNDEGRPLPRKNGEWIPCEGIIWHKLLSSGERCGSTRYNAYKYFQFEAMPIGRIILPRKEVIKTTKDGK